MVEVNKELTLVQYTHGHVHCKYALEAHFATVSMNSMLQHTSRDHKKCVATYLAVVATPAPLPLPMTPPQGRSNFWLLGNNQPNSTEHTVVHVSACTPTSLSRIISLYQKCTCKCTFFGSFLGFFSNLLLRVDGVGFFLFGVEHVFLRLPTNSM